MSERKSIPLKGSTNLGVQGGGPIHIGELVDDGVRRLETVVAMALRGNPAVDAAVACMIGTKRSGRRVGKMTNCGAAYAAVEHALEEARGEPLTIFTCSWPRLENHVQNQFFEAGSRIQAKLGRSRVVFRGRKSDRRFDVVQAFARTVLQSEDPIWVPSPAETAASAAKRIAEIGEEKLESPAESTVYRALRIRFFEPIKHELNDRVWPAFRGSLGVLIPQLRIGFYRADFGIVGRSVRLVVEVDGYTYHSSREAFANDRKRDREIAMKGWQVFRFTASDALYEPESCAQQIVDFLEGETG